MTCSIESELVAFIQGQMTSSEADEVRAHLDVCTCCRETLTQFEMTFKAIQNVPLLEPSADFRKSLRERISRETKSRSQPATSTQAISSRKTVRIDASSSSERRLWLRHVPISAAIVMLSLTLLHFVLTAGFSGDFEAEIDVALAQWEQRRKAPNWREILEENQLPWPSELEAPDALHLVKHFDATTREDCLVAYTDEQLKAMKDDEGIGPKAVEEMLARSEKMILRGGTYAIPYRYLPELGGIGSRVLVMKVGARIEIWSQAAFDRYIQEKPKMEVVPPADDTGKSSSQNIPHLSEPHSNRKCDSA